MEMHCPVCLCLRVSPATQHLEAFHGSGVNGGPSYSGGALATGGAGGGRGGGVPRPTSAVERFGGMPGGSRPTSAMSRPTSAMATDRSSSRRVTMTTEDVVEYRQV